VANYAFVVLQHVDHGPLAYIPGAQPQVRTLFAVVLIAPQYRALTRAVWRSGHPGFLISLQARRCSLRLAWTEVRAAALPARVSAVQSDAAAEHEAAGLCGVITQMVFAMAVTNPSPPLKGSGPVVTGPTSE